MELQELLQSPGWGRLVNFAKQKRVEVIRKITGTPTNGLDDCIQLVQDKSELAGIEFFMNLPGFVISENELALEELIAKEQDDAEL